MPTVRSSSSSVSPAESTGSTRTSRIPYVKIAQTKSGIRIHVIPRVRMLTVVTMKLTAPANDAIDSRCRPRIQ